MNINKQLQEAFQFRHASKDFLPDKKINNEDFQTIIDAAHLSPSSFGFEPWKFLVIQDPSVREKIKEYAWGGQNQITNSSHFVIILAKKGSHLKPQAEYIQNFMKNIKGFSEEIVQTYTQFYTQFQEEDFKLETEKDLFDWAKRQTYIPLANMMNTAALLKIDSCPMEGFHEEKINKILEEHCGINPNEFGISVMVTFGHRTQPPKHAKVRQDIKDVVTYI